MPPALSPELAVDYVRELSADVRAALVLDADGELLAGPPELTAPARALLAAGGDAAELEAGGDAGVVCAVISDAHAAIAVCGRFAIGAVVRDDLRAALAALEGRAVAGPGEGRAVAGPGEGRAVAGPGEGRAVAGPAAPGGPAAGTLDPALHAAAAALVSAVQRASGA
jgi:hypothetical protein